MNDLFFLGAEPVDLQAAHLLWKSPWWAKILESTEDISPSQETFVTVLGVLAYDFSQFNKRHVKIKEFADLASMARKVRWKNIDLPRARMPRKMVLRKLERLHWNSTTARFEFDPKLNRVRPPAHKGLCWKGLDPTAKKAQAQAPGLRKSTEERHAEHLKRKERVSAMLSEAI